MKRGTVENRPTGIKKGGRDSRKEGYEKKEKLNNEQRLLNERGTCRKL